MKKYKVLARKNDKEEWKQMGVYDNEQKAQSYKKLLEDINRMEVKVV